MSCNGSSLKRCGDKCDDGVNGQEDTRKSGERGHGSLGKWAGEAVIGQRRLRRSRGLRWRRSCLLAAGWTDGSENKIPASEVCGQ